MRMIKQLLLSTIIIVLLGCTKEPALKTYSLNISPAGMVQSNTYKSKSIKVIYPEGLKNKMSQKMNFSYSSTERGTYQNSEWSDNMSKLLQGTFIEVLDESKLFKVVLSDASRAKEDYRLESTVFSFEHRVRAKESLAIVSIHFNLINVETGRIVKSKRFTYKEATPTTDAKGYVTATNVALSRLSKDLVTWLR